MRKKKISIVVHPQLLEEIENYIGERERSRFIENALLRELKRLKREQLIKAYRESAQEAEQENRFFEGVSGDGLSETW